MSQDNYDQSRQNIQGGDQDSTAGPPIRSVINIMASPQRNQSTTYDRHIHLRTPDPINDFRQSHIDYNTKKRKISVIEEDAQQEEDGRIYRAVLGKSMFPLKNTTDEIIRRINNSPSKVCNLAWSRHSNELVSTHGYSQNQVILWQYPSMEQLAVLRGHTYRVLFLSISPDGENIVTGAGDETLRFWNIFNNGEKEKRRESAFDIRTQIR